MDQQFVASQWRRINERLVYYQERLDGKRGKALPQYLEHKLSRVIPNLHEALRRISDGTYGLCISCKGEIPHERLLAIPGAIHCVECQKNEEQKAGA